MCINLALKEEYMRVAIASDHGGFCQKADIASYIEELGHEVIDFGPDSDDRCDYPDFAHKVAFAIVEGEADRGILICGTGLGMAMTADKVAGIRAAAVQNVEFARLSRQHNNANVECLSGRFVDLDTNKEIVKTFLETEFEGGRHEARVAKMMAED